MSEIIFEKTLPKGKFTVYDDMPMIENLVTVYQTHSNSILEFKNENLSEQKADGILIINENIKTYSFAIKTADCMPVVFIGHKGICIIHAGWVGLRDNILINKNIFKIDPYYCFIGPSISVESFEVQNDFKTHFPNSPYFAQNDGVQTFDLIKEASRQILDIFKNIKIESTNECTLKDLKYNSYRRDKTSKRNWNIFSI